MSFQSAGYPEAVYVHIVFCEDRDPSVFRRDIFNEAFSTLGAFQKHKPILKTLHHPIFFRRDLNIFVI